MELSFLLSVSNGEEVSRQDVPFEEIQNCNTSQVIALLDPKVLSNIFDAMKLSVGCTKKHLLWAALTCKMFRDPALNILWRSLDSLLPLLKVLSSFKLSNGVYVFYGEPRSRDWDRFDAYARRVKEFTLNHTDEHLAPSTYIQLAMLRPHPLPALEILHCLSVTPSLPHLPLLISSTIKTVNLGGCASDNIHVVDSFLSSLCFQSPKLKHLEILGRTTTPSNVDFSQFSRLRSLNVAGAVNFASLKEIGAIPRLENLVITISQSVTELEGDIGFARLKSLHLTASFPLIQSMLNFAATSHLECVTLVGVCAPALRGCVFDTPIAGIGKATLSKKQHLSRLTGTRKIEVTQSVTPENPEPSQEIQTWAPCLAKLSSRWSASLISITLLLDELTDSKKPIPLGLFSHLPPFSKVEHLRLSDCHFQPSDKEIRELALGFPELRELQLSVGDCISGDGNRATTTIEALWALAESCRHLKFLKIGLSLSYIPPFSPIIVISHGLETLSVGSVTVGSHRPTCQLLKVGRHLDRLFPRLKRVEAHTGYSADDWNQIYQIIETFQGVRMDDGKRRNF